MAIAETLTKDFVKELIAHAMSNRNVFEAVVQHMKFQYFQTEAEKIVWKALTAYHKKHRTCPTYGALSQLVADNVEAVEWLAYVQTLPTGTGTNELLEQFQEYLRQMMFLDVNERIVESFNRGNKEESYKLFVETASKMQNFSILDCRFERVFTDFMERQRLRASTDQSVRFRIPTGIDELDERMGGKRGGIESGEACLILGASGSGKSQALIHLGLTASRLGFNVIHFQLEGTRDQCLNRYDAAWAGLTVDEIKTGNISPSRMKGLERIIQIGKKHDIHVEAKEEYGGMSVPELRRACQEFQRLVGNIHLIIVDYLELLTPGDGITYNPDGERHRQTKIARSLKEIAMEFNAGLWTATQASDIRREDRNNETFVLTRNQLSEDRGKIRPFDVFITLNQTDNEASEETMRIWADKLREHRNNPTPIRIANNFDKSRFYDRKRTAQLPENL